MKKSFIIALSAAVLFSGCDSYTGAGAYNGTVLGSILGSAIGGISDGPRGSDIGTIVGMAGGAIIGGAIGNAADQRRQEEIDQYQHDRAEREAARAQRQQRQQEQYDSQQNQSGQLQGQNSGSTDSGFDATNSGDDRLYDFNGSDYTGNTTTQKPQTNMPMQSSVEDLVQGMTYNPNIEVRNARFIDDSQDGRLQRGELAKIIFEIYNRGAKPVYDLQPTVVEATGNRHIFISPNMHVEQLQPGKGIRYTAIIKADNRLKDGSARFCVSVVMGNKTISKVSEFNIPTMK
jgi:outer membrane lipoprotein SlyB